MGKNDALDHVEDLCTSLTEITRVIRLDGYLVITLDVFANQGVTRNVGHPYSFTSKSLRNYLQSFGYEIKFWYLERRKLGMASYVRYRLDKHFSANRIFLGPATMNFVKSLLKQLLNRGALGEVIVVCQKKATNSLTDN